jgi:hypothetical protein
VKKRLVAAIAAILIIAFGIALALPRTHFALLGWYRGEAYFDGQPTSYWAGALKKDPFVGDRGDVSKKLCEGGPAAVPVLCELLDDEQISVRQQAHLALSLIDWSSQPMAPLQVEALVASAPEMLESLFRHMSEDERRSLLDQLRTETESKWHSERRGAAALSLVCLQGDNRPDLLRIAMHTARLLSAFAPLRCFRQVRRMTRRPRPWSRPWPMV